jgi:hypothetical protein
MGNEKIHMSAQAVTAQLKLVSQLRWLCLSLGTAKIDPRRLTRDDRMKKNEANPQKESK